MSNKLQSLIENAKHILILGHNGCDIDSLSSILLTKEIILTHFGNKEIDTFVKEKYWPVFEEYNLPHFQDLKNIEDNDTIEFNKYDLIFLVDITEFGERTAGIPQDLNAILSKTVVIDHHITTSNQTPAININHNLSSASMQVYLTFKEILDNRFNLTKNTALLAQLGIIADTNRFLYKSATPQSYKVMSELTKVHQIDLEHIEYLQSKITKSGLKVFEHILTNVKYKDSFSYTFIDPNFIEENQIQSKDLEAGYFKFLTTILTTTEGIDWGFIVKEKESGIYSVSFRSKDTNVVKYAERFGGGGHLYAAGCRIQTDGIEKAINIILKSIN